MGFPVAGIFVPTLNGGDGAQALEDWLGATKLLLGADQVQSLTIASDAITPVDPTTTSPCSLQIVVDTEGAAATDNLKAITTTNVPDGSLVLIRIADAGRVVVLKHLASGGNISLAGLLDVTLNSVYQWVLLGRRGSTFYEIAMFGREIEHVVGAAGEPAFTNSWAASGSNVPRFWKDSSGVVHIAGTALKTTVTVGTSAMFTLPAGYRPPYTQTFPIYSSVSAASPTDEIDLMQISVAGVMTWTRIGGAPSSSTVIAFIDGLSFRATQ
jgi:hypothetical protein